MPSIGYYSVVRKILSNTNFDNTTLVKASVVAKKASDDRIASMINAQLRKQTSWMNRTPKHARQFDQCPSYQQPDSEPREECIECNAPGFRV